jgi:hypothetical protein
MLCPRCDQQGTVLRVRINGTGEVVNLCDECDALWPTGVPVGATGFVDFTTYLGQPGLRALWSEVTVLTPGR